MNPEIALKPRRFARFTAWVHAHPARTYTFVGIGLVLAGGLTTAAVLWQRPQPVAKVAAEPAAAKSVPKLVYYSPLTGEVVADESSTTKPVTAVMIENSPDARPQSGLKDAEIVYEAIAEGGITRFMALYQQHQPEIVGPVRSVRMYYIDWVTPYNASIAHVGGSYKALKLIRGGTYRDIDQFYNSAYYRRTADRYPPHNVYTGFTKLAALNTTKGYTSSKPIAIERTDDAPNSTQNGTQINVKISGPLYNSSYSYDAATKLYARSQAGAPHTDREAGQIQAKVVVALRVNMSHVFEDGYRENIVTSGSGQAIVFQNGHAEQVTWMKNDQAGQLHFVGNDGKPYALARGTTWIAAVPTVGGDVTWQ